MPSPIDMALDHVDFRCTICGAKAGTCACWTECACGRSYQTGTACPGPACSIKRESKELAEIVAAGVVREMKTMYPEPMRFASGGFRKTLEATIQDVVLLTLVEVITAEHEAAKTLTLRKRRP